MAKKIKKTVKAKPKKKAKAAKKAAKKAVRKGKSLNRDAGRAETMVRPVMSLDASMILVDYRIEPPAVDMPGVAIAFRHVITVNGEDGADSFHVLFSQITSPNWQINEPLDRNFPVNRVGIHRINDGLAFSLKQGRQRVRNEVFTVRASGWLASRPANRISASIIVTVK